MFKSRPIHRPSLLDNSPLFPIIKDCRCSTTGEINIASMQNIRVVLGVGISRISILGLDVVAQRALLCMHGLALLVEILGDRRQRGDEAGTDLGGRPEWGRRSWSALKGTAFFTGL